MPTECSTQIRPSNPNTPPSLPPAGRPERSWILTHVGIKAGQHEPTALKSCRKNKDTSWATCREEAPHSAPYRSALIYSNTLTETPPSPPLWGELKKGCWTNFKRQSRCCGMDCVVTAAALLLTHLVPTDMWIFGLRDCKTTLVRSAKNSNKTRLSKT